MSSPSRPIVAMRSSSSTRSLPSWVARSRTRSSSLRRRAASFSWLMIARSPWWASRRSPSIAFSTWRSSVLAVTSAAVASVRSTSSCATISSSSRISRFCPSTPAPWLSRDPPATTPRASTTSPSTVTSVAAAPAWCSATARSRLSTTTASPNRLAATPA
jgi:hypothetical protein